MEPLKTRSHQVLERVENMPHKVHYSFAKMSVDKKGKCNTIYRLYACLKAICNVKRSISNLFFKSSFSERMIQVASTRKIPRRLGVQRLVALPLGRRGTMVCDGTLCRFR
jgi:hypothetical protein